jgi:hypothetical protein
MVCRKGEKGIRETVLEFWLFWLFVGERKSVGRLAAWLAAEVAGSHARETDIYQWRLKVIISFIPLA